MFIVVRYLFHRNYYYYYLNYLSIPSVVSSDPSLHLTVAVVIWLRISWELSQKNCKDRKIRMGYLEKCDD